MDELITNMSANMSYMENVVRQITVSTTELFRDPKIWRSIRQEVLPGMVNLDRIRIWHPGCSTGQEVYSMMILLAEMGLFEKSDIYASDINVDFIEKAKEGKYKYKFNEVYLRNFDLVFNDQEDEKQGMKRIPYEKYFTINEMMDQISMKQFLTDKPFFRKIDLVRELNSFNTKYDLIICRNVIIYFDYELQNKVFRLFYQNLTDQGCLILGMHESILGPNLNLFDKKNIAYYKKSEPR
jgi:chemotaxis protein methyltransferase CheR